MMFRVRLVPWYCRYKSRPKSIMIACHVIIVAVSVISVTNAYRLDVFRGFRNPFFSLRSTPTSSDAKALVFNDVLDRQMGRKISEFFYDYAAATSYENESSSINRSPSLSASTSFRIFNRSEVTNDSSVGFNYIEKVLSSILSELGDESKFVEYWWRGHWNSHVLHRDVDELLLIRENVERFPQNAHVLYLDFDEELSLQSGGHTVVLEDSPVQRQLYVVPPRPCRLLRFQGNLLHGVPRPAFEFYLRDQEPDWIQKITAALQLKVPPTLDYSLDNSTAIRRSVLLFNTWGDRPPLSVQAATHQPSTTTLAELPPICNPICEWQLAPFISPRASNNYDNKEMELSSQEKQDGEEQQDITLRFVLPVDRRRRDRYEKTMTLQSNSATDVVAFFIDKENPDRQPFVIALSDNNE